MTDVKRSLLIPQYLHVGPFGEREGKELLYFSPHRRKTAVVDIPVFGVQGMDIGTPDRGVERTSPQLGRDDIAVRQGSLGYRTAFGGA